MIYFSRLNLIAPFFCLLVFVVINTNATRSLRSFLIKLLNSAILYWH